MRLSNPRVGANAWVRQSRSQHLETLKRLAAFVYISAASSYLLPPPKSDQEASFFSAFSTSARALSSCDMSSVPIAGKAAHGQGFNSFRYGTSFLEVDILWPRWVARIVGPFNFGIW